MCADLIGQTILGQFRVDAFIASGGMGAVYRVWDLKRNVSLAMKVLHADLADDPSIIKRFKREANALRKLAHPNIVPFYGLYQTSDFAFLLERYVDGPSLKDILRKRQGKPLPLEEVLTYLKAISAALGYAHANGVVHCDVKPGNVMIDKGGNIYLTDFGIARHSESTTTTLSTVGTAAYMAPEQIRGEAVCPATDIYALGVTLYEMLTGQRPFKGDEKQTESSGSTANERIRFGHLTLSPPDPRNLNPVLPDGIIYAVLKALNKNPQQRYQSANRLFEAFCNSIDVNPESLPERAMDVNGLWIPGREIEQTNAMLTGLPRRRAISGIIIGFSLIIIVILFILRQPKINIYLQDRIEDASSTSLYEVSPIKTTVMPILQVTETLIIQSTNTTINVPVYEKTNTPFLIDTPTTINDSLAVLNSKPPGKIAYTCEVSRDDNIYDQICIVNADGTGQRQLTNTEGSSLYPTISSDGNHIVFISNMSGDHAIYDMDLSSGKTIPLTPVLGEPTSPSISPNDNLIAFANKRDNVMSLYIMNRDGSNIHDIFSGGGAYPSWSPDSSQLSFFSSDGSIYVIDVNGSNPHPLSFSSNLGSRSSWSPDGNYIAIFQGVKPSRQIFLINTNGVIAQQVTTIGDNLSPAFSPDGNWIGFLCYPEGYQSTKQGEICVIKKDGSDLQVLTHNSLLDWLPYWGP